VRPPPATLDGNWTGASQACEASGELRLKGGALAGTIRFGQERYEIAGALDEDWRVSLFLNMTGQYGRRLEGRFPILAISGLVGQGSHGAGTSSTFATDCATSLTFARIKG